ncbi:MAG: hypothetical protein IJX55_11065 [Clostridia bacterium]|nr:hypothetical protein [Clostridia bacterium]
MKSKKARVFLQSIQINIKKFSLSKINYKKSLTKLYKYDKIHIRKSAIKCFLLAANKKSNSSRPYVQKEV